MPFLLVVGAACLLIMLEPDMGTTMVSPSPPARP